MAKLRNTRRRLRRLVAPLRMMPDFIILGGMRCGTTSLYNYMIEHPRIAAAFKKEVHFYDLHYHEGLSWYRAHFPLSITRSLRRAGGSDLVTGEASPYYLFHPAVPERVKQWSPDAKLIALLRNPVERAFSQYQLQIRNGKETLSFEEAIDLEQERIAGEAEKLLEDERAFSPRHRHFSYLTRGIYADQLERWYRLFPREQLLVINSDRFYAEPAGTMDRIYGFLGLPPHSAAQYKRYNATGDRRLLPETRERLVRFFTPHNERLYELLGEDFGWDRVMQSVECFA